MGLTANRQHDERYDAAEDFLQASYKLREAIWEDGAVLRDRVGRRFSDPAKVHRVQHNGPYYPIDGIHLCEPSPQRTPVLYQAGTSGRGRRFAARRVECIFLNGPTKANVSAAVRDIRALARAEGRDPYDIQMFLGATVIVAPTRAKALDRLAEYQQYIDAKGQLTLLSGWTGIDFSQFDPGESVRYVKSNPIQSMVENMTAHIDRPVRVRDLAALNDIGSRSPFIVGSPQEVADELTAWADETDVDGFNQFRLVMPEGLEDFVDLVVPELQSRGRFKTQYRDGTLREKLFGDQAGLRATHPGAAVHRVPA
jgi:FMN-dependent oxidoreductase (nitrilotriacetate monooxygenase family)